MDPRLPAEASSDFDSLLTRLTDELNKLLAATQASEWDRVAEISTRIVPAFEAIRAAPPAGRDNADQRRRQIEEAQRMLTCAISACTSRREQIQPLIHALDGIEEKSGKP